MIESTNQCVNKDKMLSYKLEKSEYPGFSFMLESRDEDKETNCNFNAQLFGWYFRIDLPEWICKPDRWMDEPYGNSDPWERLTQRAYGLYLFENHFVLKFGSDPFNPELYKNSPKPQTWSCFLPWSEWRHVRHCIYNLDHSLFADLTNIKDWKEKNRLLEECPKVIFEFKDFDGEEINATCHISERQWDAGSGWFKWLAHIRTPRIERSLQIQFSAETGKGKGSRKGGTVGHGIKMSRAETPERAFRRYCKEHEMAFVGVQN